MVLAVALVTASALGFSLSQKKQYSASASLLFRDPQLDQKLFGSSFVAPNTDPTREAATNLQLVSLGTVAARTAQALGSGWTQGKVSGEMTISNDGQSDVVSLTATDPNPTTAATVANAFATQYIAFRQNADRSKIAQARQLVQNQINALPPQQQRAPNGQSLKSRAEQLAILAALQTGNAELVQSAAVPTSPSIPKTRRNVLVGVLVGLLLGVGLALLMERLDRRLKSADELAETYGLPLLGAVPQTRAFAAGKTDSLSLPPAAAEAFRMLRARLRYFNIDRDIRSVLITSPAPKDGKSTVAWHLARTAALSRGTRVALVETDFRRPVIARYNGLSPIPGLTEALTHGIDLSDVIQRVPVHDQVDGEGPSLDVIVAGASPPNPAELVESHKMAQFLEHLSATYDLVVVDTPPSSVVSDAFPLMRQVSGVIVVSSLDQTTRDAAVHLRNQLTSLNAHALGVIANRVKTRRDAYYGGYEYYQSVPPDGDSPSPEAIDANGRGRSATPSGLEESPEGQQESLVEPAGDPSAEERIPNGSRSATAEGAGPPPDPVSTQKARGRGWFGR